MHEEERGSEGRQAEEVGDRGREDEGETPEDGNNDGPDVFALLGGERWKFEEFDENVVVDDFNADVAVQSGSNDTGDDAEYVADCLPGVGRDTPVGDLCCPRSEFASSYPVKLF